MRDPTLHLYTDAQLTSPYALSVFVALREKNLPFELHRVDLDAGQQHGDRYASLSLTRRVPTLVQGALALTESSAITEYLDEVFIGTPLYPAQPIARAKARQVQAWLRSDLLPIRQERSTLGVFYSVHSGPLSADAQAAAHKLCAAASALLAHGGEHLFGPWSIADVDLALMLNRLILNGDSVPEPLVMYAHRQWQRSAVQEWLRLERPPLV